MKRRRKSPADDLVHVSFCGLGIYRPGVSIAQWKWDIFKKLVLEISAMLEAMKEDLAWAESALARAEALKGTPLYTDAVAEVIAVSEALDEWAGLIDDETRERLTERTAEIERLREMNREKAQRVLELAALQEAAPLAMA